jgi:hypothetical protein
MHRFAVLMYLATALTPLAAQEPVAPPAAPADSTQAESLPTAPAPPSPEQRRFLDGLRTAARGIAQMKDGVSRVTRAQGTRDAASERRAGRFLAGLCGSGRAFLRRGRPQLSPAVYEDSVRLKARRLITQIDSLIAYAPTCEDSAARAPGATAAAVTKRVKAYDTALRDFRLAAGLPVRDDTAKTSKR